MKTVNAKITNKRTLAKIIQQAAEASRELQQITLECAIGSPDRLLLRGRAIEAKAFIGELEKLLADQPPPGKDGGQ